MGDNNLQKKQVSLSKLYEIVLGFRKAIMLAKENNEFDWRDRMQGFPRGCCDDACDLLAFYLDDRYGIYTRQKNGVFRDNNPYNTVNHVWLVWEKMVVIDITVNQPGLLSDCCEDIYIGEETLFYRNMDDIMIGMNYDITKSERLWRDYQIIMKYLDVSKEMY